MKIFKKLLALVFAVAMVMAMCTITLAANENTNEDAEPTTNSSTADSTGSITIKNPKTGNTYSYYKMFSVTYNAAHDAYSYTIKSTDSFYTLVNTGGALSSYFTLTAVPGSTDTFYVTATETASSNPAALAAAISSNLGSISPTGTISTPADSTADWKASNLALGYYFVSTTAGTICSLDTTQPNVKIADKNEEPTVEKEVQEGTSWGTKNDAAVGDTVEFRTIISAQLGATGYVLHDKMDAGLTWTGAENVKVYIENSGYTGDDKITIGESGNEKVYQPVAKADTSWSAAAGDETGGDACSFHVTFIDTWLADNITTAKNILVTYSATVNSNAVIYDTANGNNTANSNETWLKFGDSNTTTAKKTETYVYKFNVYKYAGTDENAALAGAKFKLVNSDKSKVATFDNNGKITGWVNKADTDNVDNGVISTGTELTTPENGKLTIQGLDAATYYLVETAPPDGYNKLTNPSTEIAITSTLSGASVTYTVANAAVITNQQSSDGTVLGASDAGYDAATYIKIQNNKGTELPETGGMGTRAIYALGAALVIITSVLLITRRRMNSEK